MAITDPTLYALALSEAGALYSRRACRFAAVLSGVLRKNDVVEIVHLDGRARTARVTSVPGKVLSARDPNGQIAFSDLNRKDLSRGDIIRAPGCVFRPKPISDSTSCRSPNPRHADQPVRSMAIGHSRPCRSTFGRSVESVIVMMWIVIRA